MSNYVFISRCFFKYRKIRITVIRTRNLLAFRSVFFSVRCLLCVSLIEKFCVNNNTSKCVSMNNVLLLTYIHVNQPRADNATLTVDIIQTKGLIQPKSGKNSANN